LKRVLLVTFLLATLSGAAAGARPQRGTAAQGAAKELSPGEKKELGEFVARLSDAKNAGLMGGVMWTLTHASHDDRAVREILEYFQTFFGAVEKQDHAALARLGGARGFKNKFIGYLGHADDVVQGSAALILSMTGDAEVAPHIAKLLRDPRPPRKNRWDYPRARYAGGRAAMALGLLGAAEYKPDLVRLLRAANPHDRAGAAQGLALLKAADAAPQVARLLGDDDEKVRVAAIEALLELGVARSYAKEIALKLSDEIYSEVRKAAMFALAKLKAREYSKDIAALLKERFSKSEAAMALAVMGATEHADEIAKVLEDGEGLNRVAAMQALGVLGATKYAPEIYRRGVAEKSYVENYAAVALVMMESREFADEALAIFGKTPDFSAYTFDLPGTMQEEIKALQERFRESYTRLKEGAAGGAPKP
jgi:HEAT repeat protein